MPSILAGAVKSRRSRPLRLELLESRAFPSFGITTAGSSYVVDTGADVVFRVARSNADITSITYHGNELTAPYGLTQRYSHYESGLSSSSTTITTSVDLAQGTAVVSATDRNLGVTQYYVARAGYDDIYMATYAGGSSPPTPGEMRFIFYLDRSKFAVDPYSDIRGRTIIEGKDVFVDPSTGFTYSKYYSSRRNIDDPYHGVTGPGVGAFMMIGSREKGSGGPFFKDIAEQGSAAEELYNYMYSGHEQTEPYRSGLQGPYILEITDGSDPVAVDYSFMDNLGITGWVAGSGRGDVGGRTVGGPAGYPVTVGLSNANAQYWTTASGSGGYRIDGVLPGTYAETVYANELAIGSRSVTIFAGSSTHANVYVAPTLVTPIWSVGSWDGTPNEFLNEPALDTEHPSDSRMASWNNVHYVIGSATDSDWPAAQWKGVNNDNQIIFTLTSDQAAIGNTLRIGITDAYAGGRPQITVNSGQPYRWTSALPAPSSQPNSRSITRGTYRGNNTVFTYGIPTSALIAGTNTIDISVNSGSSGTGFLSPAVVYDAIDFLPTSSAPTGSNIPAVAAAASASPPGGASLISLASGPFAAAGGLIANRVPAGASARTDTLPTHATIAPGTQPDTAPLLGRSTSQPVGPRSRDWSRQNVVEEAFEVPLEGNSPFLSRSRGR
jgi:rhamnogalacturonan endolyase